MPRKADASGPLGTGRRGPPGAPSGRAPGSSTTASHCGRRVSTTVSGTIVALAQDAKRISPSGPRPGRKSISGGSSGSPSQGRRPAHASHIRVKTRVAATPPSRSAAARAAATRG